MIYFDIIQIKGGESPMATHETQVLLGARVPGRLKKDLNGYCLSHGIKMNYLVTQAIREKLLELAEDSADIAVSRERLKKDEFISEARMDKYFKKRGVRT